MSWGGFFYLRLCVLISGVTVIWMAATYTPEAPPEGLVCYVKKLTGYPCPACGITRSLTAMGHGRIGDAQTYFPMILPVMCGLFVAMIGAILPDKYWRTLIQHKWLVWTISFCAVLTALGILGIWIYRL